MSSQIIDIKSDLIQIEMIFHLFRCSEKIMHKNYTTKYSYFYNMLKNITKNYF
jgi:hypothetical protein